MLHELKIEVNYLKNLIDGTKKSEIRINDRDYQKGDCLEFIDYSGLDSPKYYYFFITHIHSGLGLERNYICLSLKETVNPGQAD